MFVLLSQVTNCTREVYGLGQVMGHDYGYFSRLDLSVGLD